MPRSNRSPPQPRRRRTCGEVAICCGAAADRNLAGGAIGGGAAQVDPRLGAGYFRCKVYDSDL
jgi:hypothetical protein